MSLILQRTFIGKHNAKDSLHILASVLSRSAMKSSSSFVSPSFALQGVTDGDGKLGVDAVGELSFSSLRLKLFL